MILEFLQSEKIDVLNTRAFKTEENKITITIGSVEKQAERQIEFKGIMYTIKFGEFSGYLEEMCYYLKNACEYTANETQRKMVEKYIESYVTGSIETHKDSQR